MASATSKSTTDASFQPTCFSCDRVTADGRRQKSNPALLPPSDAMGSPASKAPEVLASHSSQSIGPSAPNNSPATGPQTSKRTALSPSISRFYASLTNVFHGGGTNGLNGDTNARATNAVDGTDATLATSTQPGHDTDAGKVCRALP